VEALELDNLRSQALITVVAAENREKKAAAHMRMKIIRIVTMKNG